MKSLEIEPQLLYDLEDVIVPYALLESLEETVEQIQTLRSKEKLKPHHQADLAAYEEYAPALAKVIEWWSAKDSNNRMRMENLISCLKD